jgi:hypothetical protein
MPYCYRPSTILNCADGKIYQKLRLLLPTRLPSALDQGRKRFSDAQEAVLLWRLPPAYRVMNISDSRHRLDNTISFGFIRNRRCSNAQYSTAEETNNTARHVLLTSAANQYSTNSGSNSCGYLFMS